MDGSAKVAAYLMGDEAIELTEPAHDAPPVFREADERRLHVRAYHHWASLLRGRLLPARADLDVAQLGALAANAVVVELGGAVPRLGFVGERLRAEAGLAVSGAAPTLADVPAGTVLARLTEPMADVVARLAPARFEAEFVSARGCDTLCRGVLLPLSSDGAAVDALFGVINWKEIAAPALADRLAAEIAASLGTARP